MAIHQPVRQRDWISIVAMGAIAGLGLAGLAMPDYGVVALGTIGGVAVGLLARTWIRHPVAGSDPPSDDRDVVERAIQGSTDGLWDYHPRTGAVWYSDRFKELLGYEPQNFHDFAHVLASFTERLHPDDHDPTMAAVADHLERHQPYDVTYRLRRVQGDYRWFRARGQAEWNAAGEAIHMSGSITDISAQKAAESSLRKTLEQLEHQTAVAQSLAAQADAANRAKSEFLANMSHEIRTPMTAILGFAEILIEDLDPINRREIVSTIQRNGDHLLSLINDILDLSKVEAGKMTVEHTPYDPSRITAEVASLMSVRAQEAGLRLDIDFATPIPQTIQTDPTRLRQILINLIGNAIKFTESGVVRLRVACQPHADPPVMDFDVMDTGIGMTPEQAAQLFQPFTQVDTSTTRRFGGTGLGLMISNRFAQMLGGQVSVVNTAVGEGTHFRLTVGTGSLDGVPFLQDPSVVTQPRHRIEPADRPSKPTIHGVRILLAEDGPDNQTLISHVLTAAGAEVTVKDNGRLAVEAAVAERDRGRPFDLILMDMQMPVMDGYEATRQLREDDYTGPIVALTANAMEGDREDCVAAGCDEYATKPINRRRLIETIQAQLRRSTNGEQA